MSAGAFIPSTAFQAFLDGLLLSETLLDLERDQCGNPPLRGERTKAMGLRGGAAVLMVAAFEEFLRGLFEERLSPLASYPLRVEFSALPPKLREHSVYGTLDLAMKGPRFHEPIPRVDRLADIERAAKHIVAGMLNPAAFVETSGNPNSKTVKEMFKAVGVREIFDTVRPDFERQWGKPEARDFIPQKLDEIVQRRHIVAHTASVLGIGRSDLRDAVRFLKTLARVLDYELNAHIVAILT